MTKSEEYLINNGFSNVVIKGETSKNPKDWIYVSDLLDIYLEAQKSRLQTPLIDLKANVYEIKKLINEL